MSCGRTGTISTDCTGWTRMYPWPTSRALRMRRGGEVRSIHRSGHTLTTDRLEQALSLTGIASVQNRFDLLDRASDPVLKLCETHGLAFLPPFPPDGRPDR
ncbi:hypothetical protein [Streptomyces sp. NPDC059757]|uniref:hypothetical protein n=1 Tax=Streptomyces sp. NPDC059757 TaxID=3346935 RepID=UPI003660E6F0